MSTTALPGSWLPKPEAKEKRPFVLKPHLTDRPLNHNPQLEGLLNDLKGKKK